MSKLIKAIDTAVGANIAKLAGLSTVAVHKWKTNGLPATEYTGQTEHWKIIQAEAKKRGFKVSKQELFDASNELRNN